MCSYHYENLELTTDVFCNPYYKNKVGMFKTHLKITNAFQSPEYNTPSCLLLFLHSAIALELRSN